MTARPEDVLRTFDQGLLSPVERRRCDELRHPADRDARAAAHLLVRWAAARLSGGSADEVELVQCCPDCGAVDHGRPAITGSPLHVSLARSRGAVVVGAHTRPVGVDIEGATPGGGVISLRSRVLTRAESHRVLAAVDPSREFLHHWVLKECLVKLGVSTLDTLGGLEVRTEGMRRAGDGRTLSRHGPLHLADWFDERLDVVVGAAGWQPPLIHSFPVRPRG